MTVANKKYNNIYFGITDDDAARTGLSPYQSGLGIATYGVELSYITPLEKSISLTLFTSFDILGPDNAHSSFIEERGSKNQLSGGFTLTYTL